MAIEKVVLPALKFVGGKLVQAVKGASKGKSTPKTTVVGGTSPTRIVSPIIQPGTAPVVTMPELVIAKTLPRTIRPISGTRPVVAPRPTPVTSPRPVITKNTPSFTTRPSGLLVPEARAAANVADDAAETAANRLLGEQAVTRSRFRPTPVGTLQTVGQLAPMGVGLAESEGIDVPTPVEYAADALSFLSGASLAKNALGKEGFLNAATREAFGKKGPLGKSWDIFTKAGIPAFGAQQAVDAVMDTFKRLRSGVNQADATELEDAQVLSPEDLLPAPIVTEDGALSPEEQYLSEIQAAIDTLISNAEQQASQDLAAIDQQSQIEMDAIRRDYESRKQQVANNYAAALEQIAGYQDQADQLLSSAAAAAQAGYEQAAGGLQNFQAPTGLTAEEAALSGISPTALGGAAISGAALARGLAGAEQAASAAQRFATGVDLGGQLAATRGSEVDTLAALERNLLAAETESRLNATERKAEARRAKAAAREAAVNLQTNARLAIAEKVSNMTPAQIAAWRGSSASKKQFVAPDWFGKNATGPSDKVIPGITLTEYPATIGTLNDALNMVYAAMTDPAYTDPSTALAAWNALFAEIGPDYRKLLEYKKVPSSAGAMYAALFKTAPSK